MKQLTSQPEIRSIDVDIVASSMQIKLTKIEFDAVFDHAETMLKNRVFEEIQRAIKHVVTNRDLPGQLHFGENK